VKQCSTCSKKFCVFCREVNTFSCSDEAHCTWCVAPKKCSGCSKKFRKEATETCGSCNSFLCNDCRSEQCDTCDKTFCDDDCGFVDTCEQCETTYCGNCAFVVRCPRCGASCCEKCRRRGGFCSMCCEKPSKKAKTSF